MLTGFILLLILLIAFIGLIISRRTSKHDDNSESQFTQQWNTQITQNPEEGISLESKIANEEGTEIQQIQNILEDFV